MCPYKTPSVESAAKPADSQLLPCACQPFGAANRADCAELHCAILHGTTHCGLHATKKLLPLAKQPRNRFEDGNGFLAVGLGDARSCSKLFVLKRYFKDFLFAF
ncbi:MAG: hypothetical protein EBZ48_09275 [Proteobacteria bacterium]|nr:hypothetical protein [Pseudomonadota bacterium]